MNKLLPRCKSSGARDGAHLSDRRLKITSWRLTCCVFNVASNIYAFRRTNMAAQTTEQLIPTILLTAASRGLSLAMATMPC